MSGEERRPASGSSHSHGGRRPVKVWNANRNVRKALVVGTYDEFLRKGRDKLCVSVGEPVRIVLESDGTQVEDGEYFQTLPENTIFIVLRPGEAWAPAGEDIVSQVVSTIPKIVCETLAALGLQEEIPSWKIMDNKGKITVVLHWEKEHPPGQPPSLQVGPGAGTGGSSSVSRVTSRQSSTCSTIAQGGPRLLGVHGRSGASGRGSVSSTPCLSRDNSRNSASGSGAAPAPGTNGQTSMHVQTSFDSGYTSKSRGESGDRVSNDAGAFKKTGSGGQPTPLVTVINTDNETAAGAKQQQGQQPSGSGASGAGAFLGSRGPGLCMTISGAPSPRQLSRQGSSIESSTVHTHTVECAGSLASARLHQPVTSHTRGSPTSNECDFHCCSLHAGHANHQSTHKSNAATSPVQAEEGKRTLPKGAHVRFDVESLGAAANSKCEAIIELRETENGEHGAHQGEEESQSSESEGDGAEGEEGESATSNKFLLLVDQLSVDQKHHLTIKDIGIILDRLSSKILDIEKLDREKEDSDIYNWTIKATIRGDVMRELGVIYNSNYYSISEHPSYLLELPDSPVPGPGDGPNDNNG